MDQARGLELPVHDGASVQADMVKRGYVAEGYGNPPVAMCVPKFF